MRAVFFDVGGTLIQPWPSVGHVYAAVGGQFGFAATPAQMEQAFRQAWQTTRPRRTSDKNWWRLLVQQALETLKLESNEAYFEALYEAFAQAAAWRVFPDVEPALRRARERGWHVGVISNWDRRLRPLLDRLGLGTRFDSVTISCEVGAEKPDTRIFHAALAAAGVVSAEACHIGDSIREDIRGAEATGMRALLINRRAGESLGGLMEKLT